MKNFGKLNWAFSAGRIPWKNTGEEPEFISHDKISVLNTTDEEAVLEIHIFYENSQPVGTYEIKVQSKRMRKIRFNDLIDPEAMELGRNYACMLKSNVPVVVQFSRMNTGMTENAEMSSMAFPIDD